MRKLFLALVAAVVVVAGSNAAFACTKCCKLASSTEHQLDDAAARSALDPAV